MALFRHPLWANNAKVYPGRCTLVRHDKNEFLVIAILKKKSFSSSSSSQSGPGTVLQLQSVKGHFSDTAVRSLSPLLLLTKETFI